MKLTTSRVQAAETPAPKPEKLAFSVDEACALSGLGRSYLYAEIKAGRLATRKAGSRTLVLRKDLEGFLESLPVAVSAPDVAA